MQPIDSTQLKSLLTGYAGRRTYLHYEFARGGFLRNIPVDIDEAVLRGDGPYRVALRCREHGWVIMEDLTHMESGAHLFLCALESDQRLARALQLSPEPFAP